MTTKRKLSIVHINTHDVAGGAAKVAWRLAEAQRACGHKSRMLVGFKNEDSENSTAFDPAPDQAMREKCRHNGRLYYEFQGSDSLPGHPWVESADLLHLHNLHGDYFNPFSLTALARAKPVIWTLHDMQALTGHCAHSFECERWRTGCGECPRLDIDPAISVDSSAQLWLDKKTIYEQSHLQIVTPSQWLKEKVERSILKDHPVTLIHNGIDTRIFRPTRDVQLRRDLGIPDDAVLVGSVANYGAFVNPWKGGAALLDTLSYLLQRIPNLIFLNIGSNEPSQHPKIVNVPAVTDEELLARLYSQLDLYLYAPLADNCPLVVLEAMACGIPLVTFGAGGVPELVRNGVDGIVVAANDGRALAHGAERLLNNPEERKRMGSTARERVLEKFDHQVIAGQYERIYLDMLITSRSVPSGKTSYAKPSQTGKSEGISIIKGAHPRISIITPSLNQGEYLEHCIDSILSQNYPNLEYIIMDGGSKDNSVNIIKKNEKHLAYWQSRPDNGHYSALNEGFKRSTGEIMGWLNSDDMFHRNGLQVIADVFGNLPDVRFLTGKRVGFDADGNLLSYGLESQTWCRNFLLDPTTPRSHIFVMQEATYWRRDLWEEAGAELALSYQLAADYELWLRFLRFAQLHTVDALIAGFRKCGKDQRSQLFLNDYLTECQQAIGKERQIVSRQPALDAVAPALISYPLSRTANVNLPADALTDSSCAKKSHSFYPKSGTMKKDRYPKISLVTPSYNQGKFLEECIDSILSQNYPNLEYLVMDGGSTDDSVRIIKKYEKHLAYWQSRPDGGQYQAVEDGFRKSTGEIMTWLNSDDKLHPFALDTIAAVFSEYPKVDWIMGRPNGFDEDGHQAWIFDYLPLWRREKYLEKEYRDPYIQQEGTFWRRELWEKAGGFLKTDLRMAGDLELWTRFFRHAQLCTVDALLAGYRQHKEQKTARFLEEYHREAEAVLDLEREFFRHSRDKTLLPAPQPIIITQKSHAYLVSAIVSTYNSEDFIRGCLDDLTAQTLYEQGKLEIVVVDSGSTQNEGAIVKEFQRTHPHIRYLRTERETMYAAWNRALEAAAGKFITNANTDDRHRADAFELLSKALEDNPGMDLVYGDCYVSSLPNETFVENRKDRLYRYPEFFAPAALIHYQFGPQSMWRKSVHERIGLFDGSYKAAGDYDFNIRFALKCKALHIPESLGLYLEHDGAITFKDNTMALENSRIAGRYRIPAFVERLYRQAGVPATTAEEKARIFLDMGVRSFQYYPPWKTGDPETNLPFAITCFEKAAELLPDWPASRNNLAIAYWCAGQREQALGILASASGKESDPALRATIAALQGKEGCTASLVPSGLSIPSQHELAMAGKVERTPGIAPSPLNICMVASTGIIAPTGSVGGLETAMRLTAAALAARGHRVAVVGYLRENPGRFEGVEYLPFDEWSRGEHPAFSKEADILAFASGPDLGSYLNVGQGTGKVVLFHHQQLSFLTGKDPLAVLNREADVAICVSNAVRENLVRDGVSREKLEVVPNGVDPGVFYPRDVNREAHRILFVGALVPDKNVHLLIEAFLKISPNFPDAELHICGSASLWGGPEYINRDTVARLSPRIFFHGVLSHEELACQYSRSTVCVIPSRYESFSLVSLEAQACGCVPLAANVGGVPETIIPGSTGFIYEPNDADTLARNLTQLLENGRKLEAAGKNAAAFIKDKFSWDATAQGYEAIFHDVIKSKRDGKCPQPGDRSRESAPVVSVIIPCYNYGRYLGEAVESVIGQTFRDFEIIIVNDGSTDDTAEVAEQLIKSHPGREIRLINQSNSGKPAVSRNRGILAAKGDLVLPLDADDKIDPHFLEKAFAVLKNEPDIGIVYSNIRHFGAEQDIWQCGEFRLETLANDNVVPYCALFCKDLWRDIGGYREDVGYEDWHFWLDACERGYNGRLIPEPLFHYRKHDQGQLAKDNNKRQQLLAEISEKHPRLYGPSIAPGRTSSAGTTRVLIACTHFWPSIGGVETIAGELGSHLVERGYQVEVATWARDDRTSTSHNGVRIIELEMKQAESGVPAWVTQLRGLALSGDYAACILLADPQNLIIWSLEGAEMPAGTRLLIQPLINEEGFGNWHDNREFRSRLAAILKKADAVIAISREGAGMRFFADEGITPLYIPNATGRLAGKAGFRSHHGIPEGTPLLLHVANLWPVKNHDGLLRALRDMPGDWRLAMIGHPSGDADYVGRVRAEAARDPRVVLIPGLPPEEISAAMAAADIFLLASHGEVSPVTIMEAMSHARPWLATPECGAVHDFAGGVIAPLERFPEILGRLLARGDIRDSLGSAGQRHWQECFTWNRVAAAWEELILTGALKSRFEMPADAAAKMKSITGEINMLSSEQNSGAPLVSVIVPTFNRPDMLVATLRSILSQTYQNHEIIVVNDAGADVEGIVNLLNRDGKITYVRHARNRGLAAARNTGIRIARGKYIAYLDDDDLYYPEHLETLVTFLEGSDCKVAYTDAHRAHQAMDCGRYAISGRDLPYSHDFDYDAILVNNFVPVLCFMHEKSCIDESGLFDESMTTHEDWDMWIRMSRSFRFAHLKKVTCEFTWRQDGSTMTSAKREDFIRTARLIYEKHRHLAAGKPAVLEGQAKALSAWEPAGDKTQRREDVLRQAKPVRPEPTASAGMKEDHAARRLEQADNLVKEGKLSEALARYQSILGMDTDNHRAMTGIGVIRLLEGKRDEAGISFDRALRIAPDDAKAWCGAGMVEGMKGRAGAAFECFSRALESDPENLAALGELVKCAYRLERFTEAERHLENYLRYHPADLDMLFSQAGIQFRAGKNEEALDNIEKLLIFAPEYEGGQELKRKIETMPGLDQAPAYQYSIAG